MNLFASPMDLSNAPGGDQTWLTSIFPPLFSFLAAFSTTNSYVFNSAKLLLLGTIIETGRRLFIWLVERFRIQYSITAEFTEGDPAYEWLIHFLTHEQLWRRSYDFRVFATNSKRRWSIGTGGSTKEPGTKKGNAEYVPTYEQPLLFRWNGYWLDIRRTMSQATNLPFQYGGTSDSGKIYVTLYTRNFAVLTELVEEVRLLYLEVSRPNVIVHMADGPHYAPTSFTWTNVKCKVRRALSSIVLPNGVMESIVEDAKEFIDSEEWYHERGIPYHRGFLLYGPPGSGKTSTIYALAGALGMEIYSVSLASSFVDDSYLQSAASSIPKNSIFLIEDIDCAFPSREERDNQPNGYIPGMPPMDPPWMLASGSRRSSVTLSGLLNVLDGVGSEEGKLFFATTNYVDRLDPALLRPGRIDRKVEYSLATKDQATSLFAQFYPEAQFPHIMPNHDLSTDSHAEVTVTTEGQSDFDSDSIAQLSKEFGNRVPLDEFSIAELQGYLLTCKKQPLEAVKGVADWIVFQRKERKEKSEREEAERERAKRRRRRWQGYIILRLQLRLRQRMKQMILKGICSSRGVDELV
ncbi:hypothetical protein D9758_009975 [Tetrapyrgos nigripes]|uniref:P-loop containing nucleoside triphosphate hydrolase protein n=1 Tax=Tetrapyrgos nigripes TaxID=182062 RepID=A0A8H5CSD8_9AGAR|nr:hypothetical protein D9758_009975 [Tetrapyrgos nigripes]